METFKLVIKVKGLKYGFKFAVVLEIVDSPGLWNIWLQNFS